MDTSAFDYDLPPSAIAQVPVEPRDSARLLVDATHGPEDRLVRDLPDLLEDGDVVVRNTTRVIPARLHLRKRTGGHVEVFLLEPEGDDGAWSALVRPSRRVAPGTVLRAGADLEVEVGARLDDGKRLVRLRTDNLDAALGAYGAVPLPPYITTELPDPDRYQTVYADRPGSVAAPTAGLHLTEDVLARIEAGGVRLADVDLWVGLGTFRPITAARVEDHQMHTERYHVPDATWSACQEARRVIAIGTTSLRALESVAATGCRSGRTELYLRPGSPISVVDLLLTNFHLPRSSLLVLVEAFSGPRWRDLYAHARASGYRFLSFGDAMLLRRSTTA